MRCTTPASRSWRNRRLGIELVRELELYNQAGFAPADTLRSATIVPARVVGADARTGSLAVGKEAAMVLVDGDVSRDLGALRRVVTVVSDGHVMNADALRAAAGYRGRPKWRRRPSAWRRP